jgi:hypothetical protein
MRTIGRKVIKEVATTDQTKLAGCGVQTSGISMETSGVRFPNTNDSFAHLSPLPAIWVLYAIGMKGPIKILCMQIEVILRPMDLSIYYLEACTAFATENRNHIPMFGSDGTLQSHWKSIISRDNPKQPGISSIPYVPGQFWTRRERPSVTNVHVRDS